MLTVRFVSTKLHLIPYISFYPEGRRENKQHFASARPDALFRVVAESKYQVDGG